MSRNNRIVSVGGNIEQQWLCRGCRLWTNDTPGNWMTAVDNWDDETTEEIDWEKKIAGKAAEKVAATEDRYPHRCPRCQRKCYIGLNDVEHPPEVSCTP